MQEIHTNVIRGTNMSELRNDAADMCSDLYMDSIEGNETRKHAATYVRNFFEGSVSACVRGFGVAFTRATCFLCLVECRHA